MVDNFSNARLNSTRINNYKLKQLKNESAKDIAVLYKRNTNKSDPDLIKAAYMYYMSHRGILEIEFTKNDLQKMTPDTIDSFFSEIKGKASRNFIKFYKSYERKIKMGYSQEYVNNAYQDLKIAYIRYRAVFSPQLELDESRITTNEMVNLFYILANQQGDDSYENKNDYESVK